jgi:hypothetical protein
MVTQRSPSVPGPSEVAQPRPTATYAARVVVAALVLGPWLLFLTSLQVPLYPADGAPPPSPIPTLAVVVAVGASAVMRALVPTTRLHVLFLAVTTCGVATLAAHIGDPLANATATYCGDLCRTAIMFRFVAFFGWSVVMAAGLALLARWERSGGRAGSGIRVAWSLAWASAVLVLGLPAAVAWWRIILPSG